MKDIEKMYRDYAKPVMKYVMSLCHNETLAEDITADTFFKAIKNIDSFDESTRMLTWLCSIAKNTYFDYVRKKENKNFSITEEMQEVFCKAGKSPEEAFEKKDERMLLYKSIQKMEGEMKDVIYLRIFGELSFREIGDILGKSENWARVTFYRGKNKLKGWMENED